MPGAGGRRASRAHRHLAITQCLDADEPEPEPDPDPCPPPEPDDDADEPDELPDDPDLRAADPDEPEDPDPPLLELPDGPEPWAPEDPDAPELEPADPDDPEPGLSGPDPAAPEPEDPADAEDPSRLELPAGPEPCAPEDPEPPELEPADPDDPDPELCGADPAAPEPEDPADAEDPSRLELPAGPEPWGPEDPDPPGRGLDPDDATSGGPGRVAGGAGAASTTSTGATSTAALTAAEPPWSEVLGDEPADLVPVGGFVGPVAVSPWALTTPFEGWGCDCVDAGTPVEPATTESPVPCPPPSEPTTFAGDGDAEGAVRVDGVSLAPEKTPTRGGEMCELDPSEGGRGGAPETASLWDLSPDRGERPSTPPSIWAGVVVPFGVGVGSRRGCAARAITAAATGAVPSVGSGRGALAATATSWSQRDAWACSIDT